MLTPAHRAAKRWFDRQGISIAAWAREHEFNAQLVYQVLNGRNAKRGESHRIAVALGIKSGVVEGQK